MEGGGGEGRRQQGYIRTIDGQRAGGRGERGRGSSRGMGSPASLQATADVIALALRSNRQSTHIGVLTAWGGWCTGTHQACARASLARMHCLGTGWIGVPAREPERRSAVEMRRRGECTGNARATSHSKSSDSKRRRRGVVSSWWKRVARAFEGRMGGGDSGC